MATNSATRTKYHLISRRKIRQKDLTALYDHKPGYLRFIAPKSNKKHSHEILFQTPRGFFLLWNELIENRAVGYFHHQIVGEVSISTAQKWLDECNISRTL